MNIYKAEPGEVRQDSTSSQGSPSLDLWIWRNENPYSLNLSLRLSQDPRAQLILLTGMVKLELLTFLLLSLSRLCANSNNIY